MTKLDKQAILFFTHTNQYQELMFIREREFKIFAWSNSIFIALIGLLAIVDKSKSAIWEPLGLEGKIIVSVVISLLAFFSISWQNRERKVSNLNAQVISKINKIFSVYEKGKFNMDNNTSLFPTEWENWGKSSTNLFKRYFRANLITATWMLCVLCILMVIIS